MQIALSAGQVEAFYHDEFVASQLKHFHALVLEPGIPARKVLDIGGGCGHFATALQEETGHLVCVLDSDPLSVAACRERGLSAIQGDALDPPMDVQQDVVCFNLILHHLVGETERATLGMQSKAISLWKNRAGAVFIDEYIYDSYVPAASGRLIYWITRSAALSAVAKLVGRLIPSLRANTLGVGVRFRSRNEWIGIFNSLGYRVVGDIRGPEENVSLARRMMLIRSCRRDSFLLLADAPPKNQVTSI